MKLWKRTLACLLAVLLAVGMLSTSAFAVTETDVTVGDVNGSGTVDVIDVLIALKVLNGKKYTGTFVGETLFADGDEKGDTGDVVKILQLVAGLNPDITPLAAGARVAQNTSTNLFEIVNVMTLLSQNLLHSSHLKESGMYRDECFESLVAKYAPTVLSLQEYRGNWPSLIGTGTKVAYVDESGNATRNLSDLQHNENNRNYVINTTETSLLGEGYQGYVQDRAKDGLYNGYSKVAAATAWTNALKTDPDADPLDYAYQPSEQLAIYWDTSVLELATDAEGDPMVGRFFISEVIEDEDGNVTIPDYVPSKGIDIDYEGTDVDGDGKVTLNGVDTITSLQNNVNRLCIWVKLKVIGQEEYFYVFNAHGPNVGDNNADVDAIMKPAMNTILTGIEKAITDNGDDPDAIGVMLTGDLNVDYLACKSATIDPAYGNTDGYYDRPAWNMLEEVFNDVAVLKQGENVDGTMRGGVNPCDSTDLGNVKTDEAAGTWRVTNKPDYFFVRDNKYITTMNYKVLYDTFTVDDSSGTPVVTNAGDFDPFAEDLDGRWCISDHFGILGEFVFAH